MDTQEENSASKPRIRLRFLAKTQSPETLTLSQNLDSCGLQLWLRAKTRSPGTLTVSQKLDSCGLQLWLQAKTWTLGDSDSSCWMMVILMIMMVIMMMMMMMLTLCSRWGKCCRTTVRHRPVMARWHRQSTGNTEEDWLDYTCTQHYHCITDVWPLVQWNAKFKAVKNSQNFNGQLDKN